MDWRRDLKLYEADNLSRTAPIQGRGGRFLKGTGWQSENIRAFSVGDIEE